MGSAQCLDSLVLPMVNGVYGKELWKLASVYLPSSLTSDGYPYRKVWREGLRSRHQD
jgi:hypothetical protein